MSDINLDGLEFEKLTPEVQAIWNSESELLKRNVTEDLRHYENKFTDLTCVTCPALRVCVDYRFDLYNTDGDCLAMK